MRENEGRPGAVIKLVIEYDPQADKRYLLLDMLATDVHSQGHGFASELVRFSDEVARSLGIDELRLDALTKELKSWYDSKIFNYEEYGSEFHDPDWGILTPKRKRI